MIHALAAVGRSIKTATALLKVVKATQFQEETIMMELSDVRNELDNSAKKLADFRGSL